MKRFNLEIAVGIFLIIGFLCFAWVAVRLGHVGFFAQKTYPLSANFGSVAGLKPGASVEIAGVQIGQVKDITLDQEYYEAVVHMQLNDDVRIQKDAIAAIRTTGIIGEKFVSISPGGSPEYLKPGGKITETESSISLEDLIGKYVFQGK